MNKDNLSTQESLDLITRMIATAKGNVSQGAFHMLLWGWVVMILSAAHFVILKFQWLPHPEMVWLLTFPTFFVSFYMGYKKGKQAGVSTHLDKTYMWVWVAFSITLVVVFLSIMGNWAVLYATILALAGYATFLSGMLIKFKPMIYGAIGFWLWALVAAFAGPMYGLLAVSAGILTGYLIPGYLLKSRSNES